MLYSKFSNFFIFMTEFSDKSDKQQLGGIPGLDLAQRKQTDMPNRENWSNFKDDEFLGKKN